MWSSNGFDCSGGWVHDCCLCDGATGGFDYCSQINDWEY